MMMICPLDWRNKEYLEIQALIIIRLKKQWKILLLMDSIIMLPIKNLIGNQAKMQIMDKLKI